MKWLDILSKILPIAAAGIEAAAEVEDKKKAKAERKEAKKAAKKAAKEDRSSG